MPKESWNITDFSGGFNSLVDKRDVEESEAAFVTDLIAYKKGSLKLQGVFTLPEESTSTEGFMSESFTVNTSNSNHSLQPNYSFVKFGKGVVTTSDGIATVTSQAHGLSGGCKIQFIGGAFSGMLGQEKEVTTTDAAGASLGPDIFTFVTGLSATGENIYWSIQAKLASTSTFTPDSILSDSGVENKYILKANSSTRFGFYDIEDTSFYGSSNSELQAIGTDAWFFDTQYLWNFNQVGTNHIGITNLPSDAVLDHSITSGFYLDGVFRVQETPPEYWLHGYIRRPVGLYYIERHYKLNKLYHSGWYPLTSHILSPCDYRDNTNYDNSFHQSGGIIQGTQTDVPIPTSVGTVNIGITDTVSSGDWDFSTVHEYIRLGVSFIYDDPNFKTPDSGSQESTVKWLTSNGTAATSARTGIAISGGVDNRGLSIQTRIKIGNMASSTINQELFTNSAEDGIPQNRGSGINEGYSNFDAWNPRIVGINIWYAPDFETIQSGDPIHMHTINFNYSYADSFTVSGTYPNEYIDHFKSHYTIPSAFTYEDMLHGYSSRENIKHWYQTSVVVNRRLYAGNISTFEDDSYHGPYALLNDESRIKHSPDTIIYSPINRFDILPDTIEHKFMIARNDGQNIVKLESFHNQLLIYKSTDLFILDVNADSGETVLPVLIQTLYGKGIGSQNHIAKSDNYIFSMNKTGIYAYDGESIRDLTSDKLDPDFFSRNIYKKGGRLLYDPSENLLLVVTDYDVSIDAGDGIYNKALIINLETGGLFYKNTLVTQNVDFISNQLHIDGELYVTASSTASAESFASGQTEAVVLGVAPSGETTITTNNTGTNPTINGGTCLAGMISANNQYIKIQRNSDKNWVLLNPDGLSDIVYPKHKTGITAGKIYYENLVAVRDYMNSNLGFHSHSDDEYYIKNAFITGDENSTDATLTIVTAARLFGTTLSQIAEDVSGNHGTTAVAFTSNTVEGTDPATVGIVDGNIVSLSYDNNVVGTAASAPEWDVLVNRNSETVSGAKYIIQTRSGKYSDTINTFVYQIGVNYFINDPSYSYTVETGASNNTNNDNLIANIRQALLDGRIVSSENGSRWDNDIFTLSAISGSSGSRQFTITLGSQIMNNIQQLSYPDNYNIITNVDTHRTTSGVLLKWKPYLPVNAEDDSIYTSHVCDYQSKDIDFGEPGVRKKVYKAYITYKENGGGKLKVQYRVDGSSGSWVAVPAVYDADGNASATGSTFLENTGTESHSRAELRFGSVGNNIYSIQIRVKSNGGVISTFEINDITFIYRLKNPK